MLFKKFKNKKVLITGNTGFKGSWLTCWLLNIGADVYGISKDIPTNPSMFKSLNLENRITHFYEDICNYNSVEKLINKIKPDFIFHMAAQAIVVKSYSNPIETIQSNVVGTTNILESLRMINLKCVAIIITSDKCYDNVEWEWGYKETDSLGGKDIYSGSKAAAEIIFKSYFHSFFKDQSKSNARIASVRAGNVIGGGDWAESRIVPDGMKAWSKNNILEIRSPDSTRPWQHVLEPLSGYLTLALELDKKNNHNGESFNFGPISSYNKTVEELISDLSKYWKLKKNPYKISNNKVKFHEASLLKLNCDKALFYLKWLPKLDYDNLIEFTSKWYYEYYKGETNMFNYTLEQINNYNKISKLNKL